MELSFFNLPFWIYDLIFLVVFGLVVGFFLYKNRHKVKREMGFGLLYKAQWGVKLIDYIGGKYTKTLNFLKYIVISLGYILMVGMIYLIAKSAYLYIRYPVQLTELIKAPPLAPVIPYFPKLFGVEAFFPPFYFAYFILALGLVAIVHEFSHGIFMKHNKVKIKSTGIFFLGPFFGAFVEQEDKDFFKAKKTDQMAILGAGVFANLIFGAIFLLIWAGLFYATFIPMGTTFDDYSKNIVNVSSINMIGNISIDNLGNQEIIDFIENKNLSQDLILEGNENYLIFTKIIADDKNYFMIKGDLINQLEFNQSVVILYEDFPAINAGLKGSIIEINGDQTKTYSEFEEVMELYNPGDEISLKTKFGDEILEYNIIFAENPYREGKPLIGVSNSIMKTNIAENIALGLFKDKFTEYKVTNELLEFLYYLAFWIMLLNFLVALFNMLPFSILDGGRFFMLSVWGITKNEKIGKLVSRWVGILILAMFALMMLGWLFGWLSGLLG